MEEYLQKLVIILPATAIAMGGLLFVVFIYSRRRRKGFASTHPVPQRSVTTQVDDSLQMNRETRNKLIEEAMEIVKSILSEEFRKKQDSKISQAEFNNLYRRERCMGAKQMVRVPGVASLACAPKTRDSESLGKTHSFATLWIEELQKSGDDDSVPNTQRESEVPEKETLPIALPRHSKVLFSDSSSSTGIEPESRDCITTQLALSEATNLNEVKSQNELKLAHDLETLLLTASSNLCRSIMAFSMTQNSNAELSMAPNYDYLEHSAEVFDSVVSTSTSMDAPKLLRGGAPTAVGDFEWRLDIDEKDVEESPPTTPVRHRPPSHLCRGVRFMYEDHPPALSIIDLNPDLRHGWRWREWKDEYRKHHIYNESKGVSAYYKSVRVEAKRRWDAVKSRYREARERAFWRAELRKDIQESAEWRKYLRTSDNESSSESEADQRAARKVGVSQQGETEQGEMNQADDLNRFKSMLTSSSASSFDSDEPSERRRYLNDPQSRMEHQHCPVLPACSRSRKQRVK